MARPWSARCYGVARQREGSRQNSIGPRVKPKRPVARMTQATAAYEQNISVRTLQRRLKEART
jgi:hypothetical protein